MATEAQKFIKDHGYVQGSQEAKLTSMGYNLDDVRKQVGSWGNNMNPGELAKILPQLGPSPIQQGRNEAVANMQNIASQQYEFDPNQFLPQIQQQAESIFAPQQAQLEAIRQLQSAQYQDQAITTTEQFDQELQSTIESINSRGAYFSGGAIEAEGDIRQQKLRALNQLGMQAQAADFSNLAQQGILAAEEAQFIQDRLYNAEASAYSRFMDQRNFSYQAALQQYQVYTDERNFARSVFESDRSYEMDVQQLEMQQKQFEQTYKLSEWQFEQAKEEWEMDRKIKNLSYEQAMDKFKTKYAIDNNGLFGVSETGSDIEQNYWEEYGGGTDELGQGISTQYGQTYDGGLFDVDSFLSNNN